MIDMFLSEMVSSIPMAMFSPVTEEKRHEDMRYILECLYLNALSSRPLFTPHSRTFRSYFNVATSRLRKKYLITETTIVEDDGEQFELKKVVGFRWERLHGKNRKKLKYAMKQVTKAYDRFIELHNKYAGRNDVLCVYVRCGSGNIWSGVDWATLIQEPWFLGACDCPNDNSYCYIYADAELFRDYLASD